MKSKLVKIWGVGLALMLLASLLVAAVPTSSATLAWSVVTTPNAINGQFAPQSDVSLLDIAKDGQTMFAYSNDPADTIKLVVTVAIDPLNAATVQVIYTNQSFVALQTGTAVIPAGSTVGTQVAVTLALGDTGVRDVTNITTVGSLAVSGAFKVYGGVVGGATRMDFSSYTITGAGLGTYTDTTETSGVLGNLLGHLWKSTNAGVSWSTLNIGNGIEGNLATAMVISPNYATDSQVIVTTATQVFRSINGGQTFGQVGTLALNALTNETIRSVDLTTWYMGGDAIIIGTGDPTNVNFSGAVYLFTMTSLAWTNLNITVVGVPPPGQTGVNVPAVAFSPNHQADAQMLAVSVDVNGNTYLRAKFGSDAWNVGILPATIRGSGVTVVTPVAPTSAVLAFPSDYDWSSNNRTLVGLAGDPSGSDDLYAVWGGLPGGASIAFDKNASGQGSGTAFSIKSVTAKGPYVGGKVVCGNAGPGPSVVKISDISGTAWGPPASKAPIGSTPLVHFSPTSDDVFAATAGAHSAFSKSVDGAATFNALSLIDNSAMANMFIIDQAPVDKNTIFTVMVDNADSSVSGGFATSTPGDYATVFKTVDAGASWQMVWAQTTTTTEFMRFIALSPTYATDSTIYIGVSGDTRIWKSSTGGTSWIGLTAPAIITALYGVDGSTYYTGGTAGFYKSGRWTSPTLTAAVNSIAVAPDGTIFVGTNASDVLQSTDDGKSFIPVGVKLGLNGNNVFVAVAPDYATSKLLYAGTDNASGTGAAETDFGIFRWKIGSDTVWYHLDNGPSPGNTSTTPPTAWALATSLRATSVLFSPDGTLYATNATAGLGIRRAISPFFSKATINLAGFETVNRDLEATASLSRGKISAGSAVISAVATGVSFGSYGYNTRIVIYEDTLNVSPSLTAPKDQTILPGTITSIGSTLSIQTQVTLSWTAVSSPISIMYRYQIATDSMFANKVVDTTTPGTTITIPGTAATFIPGVTYYWRVRVDTGSPTLSKWSSAWTFTPELTAPTLQSPAYGDDTAPQRPTFSWMAVGGAADISYELQLSTNPFFAMATTKAPLSHTTWTWDEDLTYGTTYYWRVRAVKAGTLYSQWAESVFTVKVQPTPAAPPVVVTQQAPQPAPVINLPTPVVNIPAQAPPAPSPVTPTVIWAIIIIGAILVIAVVVLIVRTRRVP